MTTKVLVWDIWVRLGHWAVVFLVGFQYITGGEIEWQAAHGIVGVMILAWVLFRIFWGFFGPQSARFARFVPRSWGEIRASIQALQTKTPEHRGTHTALGGLGVVALLGLLAAAALTGASSSDDILFEGPLAPLLPSHWVSWATSAHDIVTSLLLITIGLHLIAIAWHQWAIGERLIQSMWTGYKAVAQHNTQWRAASSQIWLRGFALALVSLLLVWLTLGTRLL